MNELMGLYAIWYREFKVFLREKSRIVSSVVMPVFFLLAFGGGLGGIVSLKSGASYQMFIYPGFIAMMVLFTSIGYGAYIIWDRKFDFLKEVLVAPISRMTTFFGKILGGITDAAIEVTILLVIGLFFGIQFTALNVLLTFFIVFLLAVGIISVGLTIGSYMESPQGFGLIMNFVTFPAFLLSGALFPLDNLPSWLLVITRINPVSYAVDGLRNVLLGSSTFPYLVDVGALVAFGTVMIIIGTYSFSRMRV
jgi:ABC-2 type transport system permease protein